MRKIAPKKSQHTRTTNLKSRRRTPHATNTQTHTRHKHTHTHNKQRNHRAKPKKSCVKINRKVFPLTLSLSLSLLHTWHSLFSWHFSNWAWFLHAWPALWHCTNWLFYQHKLFSRPNCNLIGSATDCAAGRRQSEMVCIRLSVGFSSHTRAHT